jgi:hypothetical protein
MEPTQEPPSEGTTAHASPVTPRFYQRIPWNRVLVIAVVIAFWAVIGFVCTPSYFRF